MLVVTGLCSNKHNLYIGANRLARETEGERERQREREREIEIEIER